MGKNTYKFNPGDKAVLKHVGPGCHPDIEVDVIERMMDKLEPCHVCGNLWTGHGGPDYWKQNPSYRIGYPTGATGIVRAELLRRVR